MLSCARSDLRDLLVIQVCRLLNDRAAARELR